MTPGDAQLDAALARLPHGPEFRFVDRLVSLTPGRTGVGEYRVRQQTPFLRGHFPGNPLLPAVLLIEAAAQLAGVVAQSDPGILPWPGLRLTALQNVRILGAAKPGQVIRLEARVTGRLGNLVQSEARAWVGGTLVMTARLTLSGRDAAG